MVQIIGRQFKLLRDGISAGTLITFILMGRNDTYCVTEHQETKEIVSKNILVGILKINAAQSFKILMQTKCSVIWSTCTFCLVNTL